MFSKGRRRVAAPMSIIHHNFYSGRSPNNPNKWRLDFFQEFCKITTFSGCAKRRFEACACPELWISSVFPGFTGLKILGRALP